MKKTIKIFIASAVLFIFNICTVSGYYAINLPDSYYVETGGDLKLSTAFSINAVKDEDAAPSFSEQTLPKSQTASLRLFGVIPVKSVEIRTVETPMLVPSGEPFGIKLLMEGVMIINTGTIKTDSGLKCPAEECGLEKGDIILYADGKAISSNSQIQEIISNSKGEPVEIIYLHEDERKAAKLTPVFSDSDNEYKAGIWVRDSTAGIGTVTYRDPATDRFGGLGHPVCDSDTGEIIPISTGETANVTINKVVKGAKGDPGELHGNFSSGLSSGVIYCNNKYGVFGEMFTKTDESKAIPMGLKQDIEEGKAVIRTTIDETGPHDYEIEIESIDYTSSSTKNMIIRVTDKELLEKAGGIVQGMSGSPIIQNGKLIGAVTHVLVNDPKRGYGIFCESMYDSRPAN